MTSTGQERPRLSVPATVGASLVRAGMTKRGPRLYGLQRPDGTWVLATIGAARKEQLPGGARSVQLLLGLGTECKAGDMRTSALCPLGFVLGTGPDCAALCRVHNSIVEGWRGIDPAGARAAMLLAWTVDELDVNAPQVLWYREPGDLNEWARFLDGVLPGGLARLRSATLKMVGPVVTFDFAPRG